MQSNVKPWTKSKPGQWLPRPPKPEIDRCAVLQSLVINKTCGVKKLKKASVRITSKVRKTYIPIEQTSSIKTTGGAHSRRRDGDINPYASGGYHNPLL
jgi:hypothetical protein